MPERTRTEPSVTPIEALGLPKRTRNALRRWGVDTVAHLMDLGDRGRLANVSQIGAKAIGDIDAALTRDGYRRHVENEAA